MPATNSSSDSTIERKQAVDANGIGAGLLLRVIALALVPLCLFCLARDLSDLRSYNALDLRSKVVGARLLMAGRNPYDDLGSRETEQRFMTPGPAYATPAVLLLYVPLMDRSYAVQRHIYFWLDWFFVAASLFLILRYLCPTSESRYVCFIVFMIFVPCSYPFRLHLERGQYYTILLALSCYSVCALERRWTGWLACIPTSMLLLFRPTYFPLLIVAFLALKARRWTLRVICLALVFFIGTVALRGLSPWVEFKQAVQLRQEVLMEEMFIPCNVLPDVTGHRTFPNAVEGFDFSQYLPAGVNGTFTGLLYYLPLGLRCHYTSVKLLTQINSLLAILVLIGGLWVVVLSTRQKQLATAFLLAFALLWPAVLEMFTPEHILYSEVTLVLPIVLLLIALGKARPIATPAHRIAQFVTLALLPLIAVLLQQVGVLRLRWPAKFSITLLVVVPFLLALQCIWYMVRTPAGWEESSQADPSQIPQMASF